MSATVRAVDESAQARARRRVDVEWLRVAGMLLVFGLHAAEPFNPWDSWHIANPERSKWLGEFVFFLAPWIMPLFMLLAGRGAWHALARRSAREYVRERMVRLALPLVAGLLLVVPPQVYLERRLRGEFSGSFLDFYSHAFEGVYPSGNLAWHHLWFLLFLLAFALLTLPLFLWLRSLPGLRRMARLAALTEGPAGLAWLVAPAIAVRLVVTLPIAAIAPLARDWSNRALLLPAFVFGFLIEGAPGFQRAIDRHWRTAGVAALGASAALLAWAWPGHVLARLPSSGSMGGALLSAWYGGTAAFWLVALVGGARHHLTRTYPALERASELIYPFYVLHHPVVVAVAFVVVQWSAGIASKFLVIAGVSLAVTVGVCHAVARFDAFRVLFGLRWRAYRARAAIGSSPAPAASPRR